MEKELLEKIKKQLLEEERSLVSQLSKIAKREGQDWEPKYPEFREESSPGSWKDEISDEVEEFSHLVSIEKALEEKLKKVKKALKKIEEGNFGNCELCQKEIERERLKVNPTAETCITCLKKYEL